MDNSPSTPKDFIRLARPGHWIKNLLVLAPLFFGLKLTDRTLLVRALLAFAAFSLAASAVYVFNDMKDAESDRRHPVKRTRPIAAGHVSQGKAVTFMALLTAVSVGIPFFLLSPSVAMWICVYLLLNMAYSMGLKHVAILDVFIIALGFLLRPEVGSAATGIPLSMWILLITFVMALFIGLAKRRDDLILAENGVSSTRAAMDNFLKIKGEVDPDHRFTSLQSKRLAITR